MDSNVKKRLIKELKWLEETPIVSSGEYEWILACLRALDPNQFCIVYKSNRFELKVSPASIYKFFYLISELPDNTPYRAVEPLELSQKEISRAKEICEAIIKVFQNQQMDERQKIADRIAVEEEARQVFRR